MVENLLFLFTGIIGLVTTLLMIKSYKSNQLFNIYLMLVFIIISSRFLIHGSYKLGFQLYLTPDRGVSSIIYLIVVPCFYLYNKNLVLGKKTSNVSDLKHFLFIVVLYLMNTLPVIKDSFIFHFGVMTNLVAITLFFVFYSWRIFFLLRTNLWNKTNIHVRFAHYELVKNWTIYLFSHSVLALTSILISIYAEYSLGIKLSGKYMSIILLISWLVIYFKILISPEILYGLPILNKKLLQFNKPNIENLVIANETNNHWEVESTAQKNSQDLRLQENIKSNIHDYMKKVDELSYEQYVFRGSKISQTDIANKMNVSTSHIVYLFKYHSKVSFSEYRMNSRIEDAIQLIQNDYLKLNTLDSLAYKTGFSSYNPFFSAFKKITGLSPQEYLKSPKNLQTEGSKIEYEEIFD